MFAVEQLPIHFLHVSRRNVTVEKSLITVPVSGVCVCVFFLITYYIHLDETKLTTNLVLGSINLQY